MVEEFRRLPAVRAFIGELRDVKFERKGEGEKGPHYVLLPTGELAGRVFLVCVLLQKDEVRPESGMWRLRLADPTGSMHAYVSTYQPHALEAISEIEPPALIAVTGKVRVLELKDGKRVPVLRPEEIAEVGKNEQVNWIVETARKTLGRLKRLEESGEGGGAAGEALKLYGSAERYRSVVKTALEAVLSAEPGADGEPVKPGSTSDIRCEAGKAAEKGMEGGMRDHRDFEDDGVEELEGIVQELEEEVIDLTDLVGGEDEDG